MLQTIALQHCRQEVPWLPTNPNPQACKFINHGPVVCSNPRPAKKQHNKAASAEQPDQASVLSKAAGEPPAGGDEHSGDVNTDNSDIDSVEQTGGDVQKLEEEICHLHDQVRQRGKFHTSKAFWSMM